MKIEDVDTAWVEDLNKDGWAELWHTEHQYLAAREKALENDPAYVSAKANIEKIKTLVVQAIDKEGVKSFVTPHGTLHTVTRWSARVVDPDVFNKWVDEQGDHSYRDTKANVTACRDYERNAGRAVPGVELGQTVRVSITAPKVALKGTDNGEQSD